MTQPNVVGNRRLIEIDTLTGNERDITAMAEINGNELEREAAERRRIVSARYDYRIDDDRG